jgi:hypothetical protein
MDIELPRRTLTYYTRNISYKRLGYKNRLNSFYFWSDNEHEKITEIDSPSLEGGSGGEVWGECGEIVRRGAFFLAKICIFMVEGFGEDRGFWSGRLF